MRVWLAVRIPRSRKSSPNDLRSVAIAEASADAGAGVEVEVPDTTKALGQSCSELNSVQKQLVNVLREVAHPDVGVVARIRSANDSLLRNMAARAQQMDDYLVGLEKQVWAVWLPVVASAALALGFVLGTWFANMRRGTPEEPAAAQSKTLLPETPPLQVAPQRHPKHQ